jgi:signal transduction histidine kinase
MSNIVENATSPVDVRLPVPSEPMSAAEARHRIQELTTALAARDSFIALIGHELRNTLAPMVLLAESFGTLAEGSQPPAKLLSRLAMLTGNLNKLISTVGRIIEVADLRRGKLQLEPTTVDLVGLVEEVCREARREAASSAAELVIVTRGPVLGRWDRGRVKQVVANLITNAIHYSGGGRIELAVRDRGADIEIAIEDHGPGICPDLIPQLFDFADQAGSRRSNGFGTGLWVVKALCTAMQGSVTAENCSGGGARFCVALPRG